MKPLIPIPTSFIEHLQTIISYSIPRYYKNMFEFCRAIGLQQKRISDFRSGRKKFTAYYFLKIIGGVDLTPENYEKKTKKRFTKEQKAELQFLKQVEVNRFYLEKILSDPDKRVKMIKLANE